MKPWSPILCALWLGSIVSPALAQHRHHKPPAQAPAEGAETERDKQARLQFEQGRKAFDEGDYRAAWGFFHEAYRLSGRAQLLFNIGQTADRLGHDSDALTAFKLYLEQLPTADNRRDVENRVRALEARVSEAGRVPGPPSSTPPPAEVAAPQPIAAEPQPSPQPDAASGHDTAAPPPPAAASGPRPTRNGMYVRLGLGAGIRRDGVSGGNEGVVSGAGFSAEFAVGTSLWPGFVVGGAFYTDLASSPSFKTKSGNTFDLGSAHLTMFGPMADWYLDPSANGFHLSAALTFAVVAIDLENASAAIGRDASGIGAILGAGYEWPIADEWGVGVLARIGLASLADDDKSHGVFSPSLVATVTWY
ncbi:MAG TPA: hypothetical protein VJR89_08645 [Polyangiales bacterium]|nr:hypothetical protein [Polyangiales bacterium]